jgi:hypothetical protein
MPNGLHQGAWQSPHNQGAAQDGPNYAAAGTNAGGSTQAATGSLAYPTYAAAGTQAGAGSQSATGTLTYPTYAAAGTNAGGSTHGATGTFTAGGGPTALTLQVALRVGGWTMERGIVYAPFVRKVVNGRAHGLLVDGDGARLRSQANTLTLLRKPQGTAEAWAEVEVELDSDGHAYWVTAGHEVEDWDTPALWEYAIRGSTLVGLGRFAAREWAEALANATALYDPHSVVDASGVAWRAAESAGKVYVHYQGAGRADTWQAVAANPWSSGASRPSIAVEDTGAVLVCATVGGSMICKRSIDDGATWTAVP